jgi:prepilin-type N-terminal cleavage/methylation domain-containing protein
MERGNGFSMIEMMVALTVTLVVTAGAFALLNPAEGAFLVGPEITDMQQRLRVATDTLYTNLLTAGAGAYAGTQAGPLHRFFAPVLPFRRGAVGNAAAGSFTTDTITLLSVPLTAAQTTTSVPVSAASAALRVNADSGCPRNLDGTPKPLCGFEPGMTALIFDDVGRYDVFTVVAADDDIAQLAVNKPSAAATMMYPAGSKVVEVVERTYALHVDVAHQVYQLVSYDGSDHVDVPVVDNVVKLGFEYFGEVQPPALIRPVEDTIGPWTSYGPKPPRAGVKSTAYPEGENCTFTRDAEGRLAPRLATLSDSPDPEALARLTAAQLVDGPWCPDADSPDRFDADLLRIRAIAVTLRVQAGREALRGPANVLFFNAGTAIDGRRWVPDQEVRFMVAPRNLNLGR